MGTTDVRFVGMFDIEQTIKRVAKSMEVRNSIDILDRLHKIGELDDDAYIAELIKLGNFK